MSKLKKYSRMIDQLISRFTPASLELFKFAVVGGLATLVYLLAFLILNQLVSIPLYMNSILAYGIGMIISYFGQSRFTFKNTNDGASEIYKYLITAIIGIVLSVLLMDFGVEDGRIPLWLGLLGICILVPIISFFMMKLWVFKQS